MNALEMVRSDAVAPTQPDDPFNIRKLKTMRESGFQGSEGYMRVFEDSVIAGTIPKFVECRRRYPHAIHSVVVDRFLRTKRAEKAPWALHHPSRYRGHLDVDGMVPKLDWIKEHQAEIDLKFDEQKLLILAPEELFAPEPRQIDPLLMYTVHRETFANVDIKFYWPIHVWGTDIPIEDFEWRPKLLR